MSGENPFRDDLTEHFHSLYRAQNAGDGPPWCFWRGIVALKCPMDLWIYQEMIYEIKPMLIIEGGTASAGSALFIADVLNACNFGRVVSIDRDHNPSWPRHPRLTYIQGDTLDPKTWQKVAELTNGSHPKILILDDGHDHEHVYDELTLATRLLIPNDRLIVEDTNLGGPLWGLDKFLKENPRRFEREPEREKFLLTFNPKGYLKCVA